MLNQSVRIRTRVLDSLAAHASAQAPLECCGLLVGTPSLIDESVPTANLATSPVRFQVDPRDHFQLQRALRGTPRAIVGSYHSHPASRPIPSPSDVAEAHYPEFLHVIVSLVTPERPEIRAFRIRSGNVAAVELVPVP
jgi:[CysO sulfur-carrier protein]-S-L-cysteine hydrolase